MLILLKVTITMLWITVAIGITMMIFGLSIGGDHVSKMCH